MSRATPRFLSQLFLLLLVILLFVYRDAFSVKPSSDDFIALHQVSRGHQNGAATFFLASDVGDYRPLQNLTFWMFGTFSERHVVSSFRILHFLSFCLFALVAFLWIHALKSSRLGAMAAASTIFFHPIMAGPLAGLDNYSRFVVSAWVWLGALVAYRFAGRPRLAVPLVSICFIIALGYMEYAVALVPLAIVGTLWRAGNQRIYYATLMLSVLAIIFAIYCFIRLSGLVTTSPGVGHLSLDPIEWIRNVVMMLASILFFGNTVPVMLDRSWPRLAWLACNVTFLALVVGYGLWLRHRNSIVTTSGKPEPRSSAAAHRLDRLQFVGLAFAIAFFPMLLMKHVSEIYLTPITLPLALLIGFAASGWSEVRRPLGYAASVFAFLQVVFAADAIQSKVAGIKDAGERTEAMMRQLLKHVPNDGDKRKVAIVFLEEGLTPGYSIFAMPDDQLIQIGYATHAIRWFRPNQDVTLDELIVKAADDVDSNPYDLVLLWEHSTKRLHVLNRRHDEHERATTLLPSRHASAFSSQREWTMADKRPSGAQMLGCPAECSLWRNLAGNTYRAKLVPGLDRRLVHYRPRRNLERGAGVRNA